MKHSFITALLVIVSILNITTLCHPNDDILPNPIYQHKMPNGLNVVTVPFESTDIAAFYLVVRVGSRNEIEEGVTGFAHFFEHMMFRGTDKYSKEKYDELLKLIGATSNAYTSNDKTVYHIVGNADKLELMFEIESDRFQNLNYSIHDFKTEAGAVKGEYTKNISDPYGQLEEKIKMTAFTDHTYRHTTMGFFEDVVNMPNQYDYSLKFFKRFYKPEYCTIIVVGDVAPKEVNSLAEKYFGEWERGDYTSDIPVEPYQTEKRCIHLQNASIPPYLSLNFKGPAFSDSEIDVPTLKVIASILFSKRSEIYRKLVVEENKLRRLYCYIPTSRDPDLIEINATVVNREDLQYVKDEIMKTIDKIKSKSLDDKLIKEAVSNIKYRFAMRIDNPGTVAGSLAHYVSLTGDPESLNRLYALYDNINSDDIVNIANKYFMDNGLTIATISSEESELLK
ncbi:MAG: insulinase family protein [Ignavibacteria bacterium]|nr:insulinase family protein [Ignavibacteria bacterium]